MGADDRITQIRQVRGLGALAEHGLLELDEVADLRVRREAYVATQMREGTHRRLGADSTGEDHAVIEDHGPIADRGRGDAYARMDHTARSDARAFFKGDTRLDDRVVANIHIEIDVRRLRVLDCYARGHQRGVLLQTHAA
ncbi:MAG: hypothetical protein QM736_07115 [Vicinamibacterales bacterium]